MERTIRILRLYPELLDLYGDGGNLLVLSRRLEAMGHAVQYDSLELGQEKDLTAYDLIAVGAGKARNLAAAMRDLARLHDSLAAAVEAGRMVLATGTGMILLGRELRIGGDTITGTGIFPYVGTETGQVHVSDCVLTMDGLPEKVYGFVNQTLTLSYPSPANLFSVRRGDTGQDGREGMVRNNCFATTMLGPLLVKNPALCRLLLRRLLGTDFQDYDDRLAQEAWKRTMAEFPEAK